MPCPSITLGVAYCALCPAATPASRPWPPVTACAGPERQLPASGFGDGLRVDPGFRTSERPLPSRPAPRPAGTATWGARSSGFRTAGSPRPLRIRTLRSPVNIGFYVAGPTGMNGRLCNRPLRHALLFDERPAEVPTPPTPPQSKPDRAALFQAMLDIGLVANRAELARALGCSRAWVTRVLGAGVPWNKQPQTLRCRSGWALPDWQWPTGARRVAPSIY